MVEQMVMPFRVSLEKEDFKFNCAHFIAYRGFRERLHGHNYRISVTVSGEKIGPCGYLIDFGDIKKATRDICKSMNEYFICPARSDVIMINEDGMNVCLECEDGSKFSFPKSDCKMLPIVHSSAEEMARYLYCVLVRKIGVEHLAGRGIKTMEVSIAECKGQVATFYHPCPQSEEEIATLEALYVGDPSPCIGGANA